MTIVRTIDPQLWGTTTTSGAGFTISFAPPAADGEDDDGTAGVREPRRPRPAAPALAAELEVPAG